MYNKTSFINETDYAEVSGTRWIMRDLPNYAEGHELCAKLCAHNCIIQRSLRKCNVCQQSGGVWRREAVQPWTDQATSVEILPIATQL